MRDSIGLWRVPHQQAEKQESCYRVEDISINSLGMRAEELDAEKKCKIAYFGDSMLEGVQVEKKDHFISLLNEQDSLCDHLNFGLSSTGTAAQFAHWQYFSKEIPFDKVYLFFYPANDLRNNSLALETRANGGNRGYLPHFVATDSGEWQLDRNFAPFRHGLLKKSHLLRRLNRLRLSLSGRSSRQSLDQGVFRAEYDSLWREAEAATRYALLHFAEACQQAGQDFQIVLLPSVQEWQFFLGEKEKTGKLDFGKPYRRFSRFFQEQQLPYLDFYTYSLAHIRRKSLPFPYLAFPCDGHYRPAGHRLLFDMLKISTSSPFSLSSVHGSKISSPSQEIPGKSPQQGKGRN
jgi:hypothetical protein